MTHEGYWSVARWNCILPRLPYDDILRRFLYGWDLIFHEACVEHCQQPPMSFSPPPPNIIHSIGFVVFSNATTFLYSSTLKVYTMVGSTARFYVDGMLPLQLLGYAVQHGLH